MLDAPLVVTLPTGLWHHGSHRRHVSLRPIGPDEVLLVDVETGLSPAHRVTELLARCVTAMEGPDLDPHTLVRALTVGDREALLLHLRRRLIGEDLECVLRCPAPDCAEPISLELRLSDLLLPPYEQPQPAYDVPATSGGERYQLHFRLPTGADVEAAAQVASHDPAAATDLLVRNCLQEVEPAPEPGVADHLISALSPQLSAAVAARDPQAELQLDLTCPACGQGFSTLFDTAAYLLQELQQRAEKVVQEIEALAFHYHWSEPDILAMPAPRRRKYLDLLSQRLGAESS